MPGPARSPASSIWPAKTSTSRKRAGDLPWAPARRPEDASQNAVGIFIDEGGQQDRYRWKGSLPPANGEERRSDSGPLTVRADG